MSELDPNEAELAELEAIAPDLEGEAPGSEHLAREAFDSEDVAIELERLPQRRRLLRASIAIPSAAEWVWQVLTDYDRLSEFVPSLQESCCIGEEDGCQLLRQVGTETFLRLSFSAAVVLKMQETHLQRIDFVMVEGDFNEFEGSWELDAAIADDDRTPQVRLTYVVRLQPPRRMPARLIEGRLRKNLCDNLLAIRQEACARAAG